MLAIAIVIILILFLPVTFLPVVIENFFSSEELTRMGISVGKLNS